MKFAQHARTDSAVQHCLTGNNTHTHALTYTHALFGAANWQLDQTSLKIEQHFMNNMNKIQTSQQNDFEWNEWVRVGYEINRSMLYSCHILIKFCAYLCVVSKAKSLLSNPSKSLTMCLPSRANCLPDPGLTYIVRNSICLAETAGCVGIADETNSHRANCPKTLKARVEGQVCAALHKYN